MRLSPGNESNQSCKMQQPADQILKLLYFLNSSLIEIETGPNSYSGSVLDGQLLKRGQKRVWAYLSGGELLIIIKLEIFLMRVTGAILVCFLFISCISGLRPAFQSIFSGISAQSYKPLDYSVRFSNIYNPQTDNLNYYYGNPNNIVFISRGSTSTDPLENYLEYDVFGSGRHTNSIVELKQIKRKIDGSGNNEANPQYGKCNTALNRGAGVLYKNKNSQPLQSDFYPREISNAIGKSSYPFQLDPNNVTMAFTIWGQFLDHDLTLTEVNNHEKMDIKIPKCDPYFDLSCTGNKTISFKRSEYTGQYPRKHMNSITHWIDGSNVYGSDEEVANRLRAFKNGKLRVQEHNLLPLKEGDPYGLPDAGDIRAAENLLLMSYHTIFVREHNRMCDILLKKNNSLNDEQVYTSARNYVIGLIQKITFDEFLPILLGYQTYQKEIGSYRGYNASINPNIDSQFSTAAYRFGHSLLVDKFPLLDKYGQKVDEFSLHKIFFRPDLLTNQKLDLILRGLTRTIAKKREGTIIDDVRNLLITDPAHRQILLDLYSLNVQRARDHGLEKFNYLRKSYGLKPLESFEELVKDKERMQKLKECYHGDINQVDPWVGVLNEESLPGGVIGELGGTIIGRIFRRLRDGDRLWYEKAYPQNVVAEIKGTFFSEIILRNTGIKELEQDIFHYLPESNKRKMSY